MAFARVACRGQVGLHAPLVTVEVSLTSGLPAFCIVGLPAMVVRESRERVRAALLNSRFEFPAGRITVNLAPADMPKEGGRFDLPIALGLLLASRQLHSALAGERATAREFYGELGLTGELKAVPGLLPAAVAASHSRHEIIVPRANAPEACAVAPALTRAADHLLEVCAHVAGTAPLAPFTAAAGGALVMQDAAPLLDLADVRGQEHAKRALTIAAAGGHSLLLIGPPGCGKSMLAQRLPGLLPPLDAAEALEVAAIASVSGADFRRQMLRERPFRSPHHSATVPALVGGGARGRPGEISLAHHGVLFLDELPEFGRATLEALREPLETGMVAVARLARETRYPAAFQLIAAMNPCPCGRRGDLTGSCHCSPDVVRRYLGRISGPLLDRLDMQVEVAPVPPRAFEVRAAEGSAAAGAAVRRARELQLARQGICNARLADTALPRCCLPDERGREVLETAVRRFGLSGRSRVRVLKVARTIADLQGEEKLRGAHLSEALMLRCLDRVVAGASAAPSKPCSRRPA